MSLSTLPRILCVLSAFTVSLVGATPMAADEPREAFTATHVTLEDVTLTGPAGQPPRVLQKGTRVEIVSDLTAGTVAVRTQTGVGGRADARSFGRLASSIPVTEDLRAVAAGVNRFAFDLYGHLRNADGNVFVSPASISCAMAMTYAGAGGATEQQLARTLHFDLQGLSRQEFHAAYGDFTQLLNSTNERAAYVMRLANRLWGAEGYPFRPEFLELTRTDYGAELYELDFTQPESARSTINTWVEDVTAGKIANLIPSGVLGRDTRLVLSNAIYFNGAWVEPFDRSRTQDADFHVDAQTTVTTPLMFQSDDFRYAENELCQVISLPYVGGEIAMQILLPRKMDGLDELEAELSAETFTAWTRGLREREVRLYLPKFRMTQQLPLAETFQQMDLTLPFSNAADFTRMTESEQLYITEVIHKAFVDVNEQGTEAAAATAVVLAPTSAVFPVRREPVTFRADHPFVFVLRDQRTGAVLFIGRVSDPRP